MPATTPPPLARGRAAYSGIYSSIRLPTCHRRPGAASDPPQATTAPTGMMKRGARRCMRRAPPME
eukprot:scaffold3099_cov100-Isochrysis_galbana.AAC.4